MADEILNPSTVLSVCATSGERVRELTIKDGQLIFIQDKHRLAFDYNGKRRFYNQIEELDSEADRLSLLAPIEGMYYFIISTAVLWTYRDGWIQVTSRPEDIICIGIELPELGNAKENTLYVNKQSKEISVFDSALGDYITVSDYTDEITDEDIEALFA